MLKTHNQLIHLIRTWAENHKQIRTFGHGFASDLNPSLLQTEGSWLFVQTGSITPRSNTITRNYRIYALDLLLADRSNAVVS